MDEKRLLFFAKIVFFIGFAGTMVSIAYFPSVLSVQEFSWHTGTVVDVAQIGGLYTYTVSKDVLTDCSSFSPIRNGSRIAYQSPAEQCWIMAHRLRQK